MNKIIVLGVSSYLFLIRSFHNRRIEESEFNLHDYIRKCPSRLEFELEVNNKKGKTNTGHTRRRGTGRFKDSNNSLTRMAHLKVQYEKVTLELRGKTKDNLKVSVIRVFEERNDTPNEVYPIEWILITSIDVNSVDLAKLMVAFYNTRWTIETFFKTLKSGCKVQDCRLANYSKIVNYITLFSIVAWRIMWMGLIHKTDKNAPCSKVLSEVEWKALYTAIHKSKELPKKLPTVGDVIFWIAKLGGFLGRKSDKSPGVTTIWRGWTRLTDMAIMREILT